MGDGYGYCARNNLVEGAFVVENALDKDQDLREMCGGRCVGYRVALVI